MLVKVLLAKAGLHVRIEQVSRWCTGVAKVVGLFAWYFMPKVYAEALPLLQKASGVLYHFGREFYDAAAARISVRRAFDWKP